MIQTYLFLYKHHLYQLRINKQTKVYFQPWYWPTTRFQHDQISYRILTRFLSKFQQPHTGSSFIFSFLHRVQTLNLPGSSDRALWSSKSKAYPRIHVRPSFAHPFSPFFNALILSVFGFVLVYASLSLSFCNAILYLFSVFWDGPFSVTV